MVFWSEGLSNRCSVSSKSTHLADKGNRVDIIHADLCATLDFGRCDSLRTKSPALCKHQCIVLVQRIKSRLSPATSLELYLRRLPPRRLQLPGEMTFPRGKGAHEAAEIALRTRSSNSTGGRYGFSGNARFGCLPEFAASSGERETGPSRGSAPRAG